MAKAPHPMKIEPYSTNLKVALTAAEIADRADRAAQLLADRDAKEADVKAAQKHGKAMIEELDAEIRRLSSEVRNQSDYRSVDCERRYNYATSTVQDVRLDTGEVIAERGMSPNERQMELPFDRETQPKSE